MGFRSIFVAEVDGNPNLVRSVYSTRRACDRRMIRTHVRASGAER